MKRGEHLPGLDGLRGLAVLGVLFFHDHGRLRGGYLGVDLFFVLSGFLITSLLVTERAATGTIDLRAFWIRRARRLMPALLSLMLAVALYAKTIAQPSELASLRADACATLGYVANWRAILAQRSYWEMFTTPSPLEHTWSLAIEEQFYVVWPLVVAAVLAIARGRVRILGAACAVLAIASATAMALLFEEGNTLRSYLGTDTRGVAILIGAVLATAIHESTGITRTPRPLLSNIGGAIAALVLAVAWARLDGQSALLYRGGFWVTELAAAVLIFCCVRAPNGWIARALSVKPLRTIGLVSYGVYLWHWPIYVVLTEERLRIGGAALLALRLAVTFLVAAVSYVLLERPIRQHGLRWGRPFVVVPSALVLSLGFVLLSTRVVGASPSAPTPKLASAEVIAPAPSASAALPPKPVPIGFIPPASELPKGTLRVLVEGDSVALSLGARLHYAQDAAQAWADQRAIGDCSILDGIAPVFSMSGPPHGNGNCARNWVTDVEELRPDVTMVILGGAYFSTVRVDGVRRGVCHRGWHDAYAGRLADLLRSIAPYSARRVVVLAAYPVGKWQTPTLNDNVDCYNRILRDAAAASDAEVIDLNAFVCPEKKCTVMSRDAPVRPDGLHFDGLGAEDTARWVLAQLRNR